MVLDLGKDLSVDNAWTLERERDLITFIDTYDNGGRLSIVEIKEMEFVTLSLPENPTHHQ